MKKAILVIVIIISSLLQAQEKKVTYGIKAGANFTKQSGSGVDMILRTENETPDFKLGLVTGAFLEYKFSKKIALQSEILFSQQGFQKKFDNFDVEIRLMSNYINIPVMFKYYVSEKFSLETGPQLGFVLTAKGYKSRGDQEVIEDLKDQFKSTDFGVNFGAGYQFKNGIGINTRYSLGLINIFDFSVKQNNNNDSKRPLKSARPTNDPENLVIKNSVISLGLSYTF